MKMSNCWSADFETTTDPDDCRVWAYSICNIENPDEFVYGNNLTDFFEWCYNAKHNYTLYFFNLKFDAAFILTWLLECGFEYIEDKKERRDMTFTTLISDMGQYYSIEIYFEVKGQKVKKVKILDAMKIFPNFSVEKIAKGFNLPISKLSIDYNMYRPEGYELTEVEIAYIRNDVEIVARALKEMFIRGLSKMTIASDAMQNFKDHCANFTKYFPILDENVDADIRMSYRGGFTYASDKYTEKQVGKGMVLDVNSLYPYCLKKPMPYGQPKFFEGEYDPDPIYPLYIITFTCIFEIKLDKIPTIQLKNNLSFIANEYLKSSRNEQVTLTLTCIDFELFKEHYKFWDVTYHGGWKFMKAEGLFDNYVDYWTEQKIKAGKEGNAAQRQISKLLLNSLYGKFGTSIINGRKAPLLTPDGILDFVDLPEEKRKPIYIPVACFVTSYGRDKTIRTSQAIRDYTTKKYGVDKYYYSDTDSIHAGLTLEDIEELKDVLDIDDYRLGAWAIEVPEFTRAIYIRQKCYIEEIEGTISVTVAGLPKYLAPIITFDNFKRGFSTGNLTHQDLIELAEENGAGMDEVKNIHHKFTYKYVRGGVILADTDFTIK